MNFNLEDFIHFMQVKVFSGYLQSFKQYSPKVIIAWSYHTELFLHLFRPGNSWPGSNTSHSRFLSHSVR